MKHWGLELSNGTPNAPAMIVRHLLMSHLTLNTDAQKKSSTYFNAGIQQTRRKKDRNKFATWCHP